MTIQPNQQTDNAAASPLAQLVISELEALKAQDVLALDVKAMTTITDCMVIATGTSSRHVKALASTVAEKVKQQGYEVLGVEGEADAQWILVDLADVILHVMSAESREFYNLEKFWQMQP